MRSAERTDPDFMAAKCLEESGSRIGIGHAGRECVVSTTGTLSGTGHGLSSDASAGTRAANVSEITGASIRALELAAR